MYHLNLLQRLCWMPAQFLHAPLMHLWCRGYNFHTHTHTHTYSLLYSFPGFQRTLLLPPVVIFSNLITIYILFSLHHTLSTEKCMAVNMTVMFARTTITPPFIVYFICNYCSNYCPLGAVVA